MTARIDGDFRLIDRICDRCKEPTTFDSEDPYGTDKRDCFFVNVAGLQVGMEDLCYRCRDEVVKTLWGLGLRLHRDPYYVLPRTKDKSRQPPRKSNASSARILPRPGLSYPTPSRSPLT